MSGNRKSNGRRKLPDLLLPALAHDLRQPIQSLLLLLHVLSSAQDQAIRDKTTGYMEQCLRALQGMLDTASTLTALEAGTRAPRLQQCAMSTLLTRTAQDLQTVMDGRNIRLRVCGADALVACDPVLMAPLLQGLVCNALKVSTGDEVCLEWREVKGGWTVTCDYSGPPIPQAQRASYFIEVSAPPGQPPSSQTTLGIAFMSRLSEALGLQLDVSGPSSSAASTTQRLALVPGRREKKR